MVCNRILRIEQVGLYGRCCREQYWLQQWISDLLCLPAYGIWRLDPLLLRKRGCQFPAYPSSASSRRDGKGILMAAMVEFYAILSLLASILMIMGISL